MRRAAIYALRTVRHTPVRRFPRPSSNPFFSRNHALLATRAPFSSRATTPYVPAVLQSSMFFRTFSLAFISTLVASGAWYAYKGDPNKPELSPTFIVNQTSPLFQQQTSSFYSTVTTPTAVGQNSDQSSSPALVVNNDQLSATSTASEEPISKQTSESGRKVVGMLTPEEATQKLRRSEESYFVGRGQGVVRYDMVQLPSNDPIEDDHAEKIVVTTREDGSSSDWMFWGVFDGHSGWTTSAKLRQALISFVTRELNSTYQKAGASVSGSIFPSPEAIDAAIKRGFVNLDNEIVHWSVDKVLKANSKRVAAELLAPALSGSCALLAFYDSQSSMLRVACTGDSRAVLGRRAANGKWTATPLSEDQTGSTESEIQRLRQEHPGEDNVVRNGRVLGNLEPTRAFGDAFYKWKRDTQDKIKRQFFGRTPHQYLKTPPYVTAEPVVTATQVDPQKGDFLVLATDGLWEMLSNDEVVGLVGQWLEHQRASAQGKDGVKGWLQSWWSQEGQLPIEKSVREDATGQRAPIRQLQYNIPQSETRFVIEDKNAATHLIRNALGGKDKDMMCALLTLPSPYSRRYRDDLTVQVIFFGESETTGNVTINSEASASGRTVPAKL